VRLRKKFLVLLRKLDNEQFVKELIRKLKGGNLYTYIAYEEYTFNKKKYVGVLDKLRTIFNLTRKEALIVLYVLWRKGYTKFMIIGYPKGRMSKYIKYSIELFGTTKSNPFFHNVVPVDYVGFIDKPIYKDLKTEEIIKVIK